MRGGLRKTFRRGSSGEPRRRGREVVVGEVLEDLEGKNHVVRLRELVARDVGDDVGPLVGVDVQRGDGDAFRAEVVRREARADADLPAPDRPEARGPA